MSIPLAVSYRDLTARTLTGGPERESGAGRCTSGQTRRVTGRHLENSTWELYYRKLKRRCDEGLGSYLFSSTGSQTSTFSDSLQFLYDCNCLEADMDTTVLEV